MVREEPVDDRPRATHVGSERSELSKPSSER